MPRRPRARKTPVPDRRGTFGAWGWNTWESLLLRPPAGSAGDSTGDPSHDPAGALAVCAGVGAVERDVTAAVLAGEWVPPPGEWALLVVPRASGWATLVCTRGADEVIEERLGDFRGDSLRVGAYDTAGVLALRHRRHGGGAVDGSTDGAAEIVTHLVTDGVRWDEPDPDDPDEDPDDDGDTLLEGAAFPPETAAAWLAERTSDEDALNRLLTDLDAYVPGLTFDRDGRTGNSGRLTAAYGHSDFLNKKHVARVDVVRFGAVKEVPPDEAAGRRLEAAVGRGDLQAVERALKAGATVGVLPDSVHTALWLALNAASQYAAQNRPALPAIVDALLTAGADPNALAPRGWQAASPAEQLLTVEFVQSRATGKKAVANRCDTLAVLDRLIAGGLDVDLLSYGRSAHGTRPLHSAASSNRPAFVKALLAAGADPTLTDDRGLNPAAALRAQLEVYAKRDWAPNHVPLDEGLGEHAEALALLDAAEVAHG